MGRRNGEGAVFKNSAGLWEGRIELPRGPKGERRRKVIRRKSHSELLAAMSEARANLKKAGDIPTATMTVAAWFDYWMREVAVKDRRPKTVNSYRSVIEQWIKPTIGKIQLDKVTAVHVRRVFGAMERPDDGKPRSSTYMRNAHSIMSAAFADAEAEGRTPRNPVELVKAPRKAVTDLEALTPVEATNLLGVFAESPEAYLWATFILTGARRGEVLGLEWDRVGEELDLSWQLQRIGQGQAVPADFESRHIEGGLYWTRPKTRAGWRVVPLVDPLRSILERWRDVAPDNPWGLVFTRQTASGARIPVDPDYATRLWPEILKAAGIHKHVRIHDLRHTTVDLLYAAGVPEDVIQLIVGHSSRAMTRSYRSNGNLYRVTAAMKQLSATLGY